MACSTVGLISSMDGALHPVIAKVRVPFPRSSLHLSGSFSTAYVVPSNAMIILISLSYISIHVIYHELTMTCSPVGLISSMGSEYGEKRCVTILKTAARETKGQLDSSGLCDLINFRKNCHTQVHTS